MDVCVSLELARNAVALSSTMTCHSLRVLAFKRFLGIVTLEYPTVSWSPPTTKEMYFPVSLNEKLVR